MARTWARCGRRRGEQVFGHVQAMMVSGSQQVSFASRVADHRGDRLRGVRLRAGRERDAANDGGCTSAGGQPTAARARRYGVSAAWGARLCSTIVSPRTVNNVMTMGRCRVRRQLFACRCADGNVEVRRYRGVSQRLTSRARRRGELVHGVQGPWADGHSGTGRTDR